MHYLSLGESVDESDCESHFESDCESDCESNAFCFSRLSGQERPLQWIDDLFSKSPTDLQHALNDLAALRCKYPGLCSLNFEFLLDLVIEKLVGDNPEKQGIFGTMEAYAVAVEEQGRKTLHAHILVFVKHWNDLLRDMHATGARRRQKAKTDLCEYVDDLLSTSLYPDGKPPSKNTAKCPNCKSAKLEYPDDQTLRDLRHKEGAQVHGGAFVTCSSCAECYCAEELVHRRAFTGHPWVQDHHERANLLRRDVLASQTRAPNELGDREIIGKVNALYNHHLSCHTQTCFKKGDECRAFLPDIPENSTRIVQSPLPFMGAAWTGEPIELHTLTIRPQRFKEDSYTNSHSPFISDSLAPCNSNVSVTTGPRSCIYTTCYAAKKTQKEDTKEFKYLLSYVSHRFQEERKSSALFEGLSRLMGAALVATSEHVVSAPMASFLVRNESRFKCSHLFKYVPVREIIEIMTDPRNVSSSIMEHDKGCFYNNDSLQYLQRPSLLNDIPLIDFCEQWEAVRTPKPDEEDRETTFKIDDSTHPGYGKQHYRLRRQQRLAQFSHWCLPDAASFDGNIWELTYPVNASVEKYCTTVLLLFHPFRKLEDIQKDGSSFKKFANFTVGVIFQTG